MKATNLASIISALVVAGCGGGSPTGTTDGSVVPASSCLTGSVCASSAKDCAAGQRCNTALNPPECQMIYCAANGTACADDIDDAGNLCASKACRAGVCAAGDLSMPVVGAYGCDINKQGTHICLDASGPSSGTMDSCTSVLGGTLLTSCDRTGSVGGCKETNGTSTSTAWYYPPVTQADAMSACSNGTFVTP